MGEPLKLKCHSTISYRADVESYHCTPLEKVDIRGQLTLLIAFTSNPLLGYQVALSHYVPALNKSINDKYSSLIGESNPKDWPDRWDNVSNLSTLPQFHVKPMWDLINFPFYFLFLVFSRFERKLNFFAWLDNNLPINHWDHLKQQLKYFNSPLNLKKKKIKSYHYITYINLLSRSPHNHDMRVDAFFFFF